MNKGNPGLSAHLKDRLIQKALERRVQSVSSEEEVRAVPAQAERRDEPADHLCSFAEHPGYHQLRIITDGAARLGIAQPYFKLHEGIAGAHTHMQGQDVLNFASYNYLGLCGHPAVNA